MNYSSRRSATGCLVVSGILNLCALLVPAVTNAEPLTEASCSVLATREGEEPAMRDVPGLTILDRSSGAPFTLVGADGVKINAVVCWRSEARLAESDYTVPEAGFAFYVKTDYADDAMNRTLALELIGSSFRVRLLSGPAFSDAEKLEIQRLLSLYETKHREGLDRASAVGGSGTPPPTQLAPTAPRDKPYAIQSQSSYADAIAPYVAEARKTYPEAKRRFLKGLPPGHTFFVTTRLRDSQSRWEQVFVRVQSIQGDVVKGVIASQISVVKGYELGQAYSFKEAELVDWSIANPDGSEEGNFVGKFTDTLPQ
jgi:hypothetical protein